MMALGLVAVLGLLVVAGVEWPLLAWSVVHGAPTLLAPMDVAALLVDVVVPGATLPSRLARFGDVWPPAAAWILLDLLALFVLLVLAAAVWVRVDRWRGRSTVGLAAWDPRRRLRPRSWAVPRDWLHLQPVRRSRSRASRVFCCRSLRFLGGERRAPARRGGDGWNLGVLRGAEVRSDREMHLMVVAPTRAGKTRRVLATEAVEHDGPAVILSNKLDVVHMTVAARRGRGPVWIYAPLTMRADDCVGWTPLVGCERWEQALLMAQWLFDADPSASSASRSSGGARFYNKEAVELLLPALLQAAALGGCGMGAVLDWLRGGLDGLDVPRAHAAEGGGERAAAALAGVQALDERPRSLLMMSAAQLISAYRLPAVRAVDRPGFDPQELLREHGTLYLVAPEAETELLAPIFGGILGQVLRACEHGSQQVEDSRRLTPLKILADEAAHLAPLGKLPTYLAVSGGWGVRWCLVYQSLAQIRHRYGAEADAILANALCKLFLGPIHDRVTRDEIVALLGRELVERTSRTTRGLGGSSTTRQQHERPVLAPEQLARIGEGKAVAIHGRELPAVVHLPFYDELKPQDAQR
jgi:type IV secretory pathway TraG/TraD family ATPase VirD4